MRATAVLLMLAEAVPSVRAPYVRDPVDPDLSFVLPPNEQALREATY